MGLSLTVTGVEALQLDNESYEFEEEMNWENDFLRHRLLKPLYQNILSKGYP